MATPDLPEPPAAHIGRAFALQLWVTYDINHASVWERILLVIGNASSMRHRIRYRCLSDGTCVQYTIEDGKCFKLALNMERLQHLPVDPDYQKEVERSFLETLQKLASKHSIEVVDDEGCLIEVSAYINGDAERPSDTGAVSLSGIGVAFAWLFVTTVLHPIIKEFRECLKELLSSQGEFVPKVTVVLSEPHKMCKGFVGSTTDVGSFYICNLLPRNDQNESSVLAVHPCELLVLRKLKQAEKLSEEEYNRELRLFNAYVRKWLNAFDDSQTICEVVESYESLEVDSKQVNNTAFVTDLPAADEVTVLTRSSKNCYSFEDRKDKKLSCDYEGYNDESQIDGEVDSQQTAADKSQNSSRTLQNTRPNAVENVQNFRGSDADRSAAAISVSKTDEHEPSEAVAVNEKRHEGVLEQEFGEISDDACDDEIDGDFFGLAESHFERAPTVCSGSENANAEERFCFQPEANVSIKEYARHSGPFVEQRNDDEDEIGVGFCGLAESHCEKSPSFPILPENSNAPEFVLVEEEPHAVNRKTLQNALNNNERNSASSEDCLDGSSISNSTESKAETYVSDNENFRKNWPIQNETPCFIETTLNKQSLNSANLLLYDEELKQRRSPDDELDGASMEPTRDVFVVFISGDGSSKWSIFEKGDTRKRLFGATVTTGMVMSALSQSSLVDAETYPSVTMPMNKEQELARTRSVLETVLRIIESRCRNDYKKFLELLHGIQSRANRQERADVRETCVNNDCVQKNCLNPAACTQADKVDSLREENVRHKAIETDEPDCIQRETAICSRQTHAGSPCLPVEAVELRPRENDESAKSTPRDDVTRKSDPQTVERYKRSLFDMAEDKKCPPYDFELQLRSAILKDNIDIAALRNKDGCTLLHVAVILNRAPLILPLFRVGCWNKVRLLTVRSEQSYVHYGKTAEEIATSLKLRKILKELDTYTSWEKSMNLIHCSARAGNLSDVKKWLEYSSDLHMELDSMQCTTLYWACIGGNVDIVKLLLSLKVDPMRVNQRKENLLHAACMLGHSQLIEILVNECQQDLTAKDTAKKSPLLRIAENGDIESLKKLIACDMSRDLMGPMLAIAGHYGRLEFLRTVVEDYDIDLQSKDEAGKSAYIRASEQGKLDVLRYCVSKKDFNFAETDGRKRNVLHVAAEGATVEVMEFLLMALKEQLSDLSPLLDARDKYIGGELCMLIRGKDKGRDSWHYVEVSRSLMDVFMKRTRSGTIDVAKYGTLLLSGWGIDPDDSAAHEIEKRFEVRRNTHSAEDADVTPLHIAAFKDKLDVANVLIKHGAKVGIRDKFGMTPLHVAAMRGNVQLVHRLVEAGADVELMDGMMKSAAEVAEDNEHPEVVNYLKSVKYLPVVNSFRSNVLQNTIEQLGPDKIRSIQESGRDLRTYLINTLRDLTVDINETLIKLGSGPILEESNP